MRSTITLLAFVTFCALTVTVVGVGAQSWQPISDTYAWSGELVSFEAASRMMTVKSRVVGDQALTALPSHKAGDRILLTWSGFDTYADGIARVTRVGTAKTWADRFTFPVEFVDYETAPQYLTFKVQVPPASVTAMQSVKPGEWITATARHRAGSEADVLASVHPYVASPVAAITD
jgi:hypothetical protein